MPKHIGCILPAGSNSCCDNSLTSTPLPFPSFPSGGLVNVVVCSPRARDVPALVAGLGSDPEVLFSTVLIGNLTSFVEHLLPHEYEALIGQVGKTTVAGV